MVTRRRSTSYGQVANLTGEWFTYKQAADLLNLSPEAVRHRAMRGLWQRTIGNDKRIRVRLPDDWKDSVRATNKRAVHFVNGRAPAKRIIEALQDHIATLKAQLGAAETRAERLAADFVAREARLAADLTVERTLFDRMSARVDQMAAELAGEHARRAKAEQELAAELERRWRTPWTR